MHEMSLCESIVKIAARQAEKNDIKRVLKIRVAIGGESCVSEEALSFCFPHVAKGTVAEGAALEFAPDSGNAMRVIDMDVE